MVHSLSEKKPGSLAFNQVIADLGRRSTTPADSSHCVLPEPPCTPSPLDPFVPFCFLSAVSHVSYCSPTDLLCSPHPQHDQWFPQDLSSNTVKQMSNEDVISSLLATA